MEKTIDAVGDVAHGLQDNLGITAVTDDFKIMMSNTDHMKMYTGVSYVTLILLITTMASNQIVRAEDSCNDYSFWVTKQGQARCKTFRPRPIKDVPVVGQKYSFGFWKIEFGGVEPGVVCDNWPIREYPYTIFVDGNSSAAGFVMQDPCPTVKTARMLVLIATGISFLSCLAGTLFIVSNLGADPAAVKDDADKWYLWITLGLQFAASTIICVAYSLWEYKAHEALEEELKESIALQVASTPGASVGMMHTTLGYTYGMLLWAFIWPWAVFGVKLLLPFLDFEREKNGDGTRRVSKVEA